MWRERACERQQTPLNPIIKINVASICLCKPWMFSLCCNLMFQLVTFSILCCEATSQTGWKMLRLRRQKHPIGFH